MRRVVLGAALLLIPMLAVAAPAVKAKPTYYFPTTVGDTWVYETTSASGKNTVVRMQQVAKVETKGDHLLVTTHTSYGGKGAHPDTYTVSDRGVVWASSPGKSHALLVQHLRLPAKAGDTWTWEPAKADDRSREKTTYTTGKEEEVEVPAGKFKAIRVDVESTQNGARATIGSSWFAPGVGLVLLVYHDGTEEHRLVMKSLRPAR